MLQTKSLPLGEVCIVNLTGSSMPGKSIEKEKGAKQLGKYSDICTKSSGKLTTFSMK